MRKFVKGATLLGATLLLSVTVMGKTVVLKLADNHAEDYPTVMGDKYFAKLVEEKSNGRIKIEVYPGGQLGSEETTIEQVQFGAIDMVRTSLSPLVKYNDKLNALMLPYLYKDTEHMFKVLDGPIGDEFQTALVKNNMRGVSWFDGGQRNFYNTKREIKTVSDLKGMKIRVQDNALMMDLIQALGASPTPMAFGEVYGALQTGVIDGAENNTPSYDSTSHFEVAKFYTEDGHIRVPEMLLINNKKFNALSKEDQMVIIEAGKEASKKQREFWAERETRSLEKVAAGGAKITQLTDGEKQEFQKAVEKLYTKFAGKYM
ncbi:MAG: TRAP transporter substrate-binding protein, partial [Fusobacteriaceae bacterium]